MWWSQPTELGVGVGDRELSSRSSWCTVEAVHFCMHFKSSLHPAVRRVCRQLCCSCRVASFFFTSRQHTYCADKTGSTDCTVHSLLALLNKSKQVPFPDFRFACSSQSVQILSDPYTANTNSFDRINSAARTRSIELKVDNKTRPKTRPKRKETKPVSPTVIGSLPVRTTARCPMLQLPHTEPR